MEEASGSRFVLRHGASGPILSPSPTASSPVSSGVARGFLVASPSPAAPGLPVPSPSASFLIASDGEGALRKGALREGATHDGSAHDGSARIGAARNGAVRDETVRRHGVDGAGPLAHAYDGSADDRPRDAAGFVVTGDGSFFSRPSNGTGNEEAESLVATHAREQVCFHRQ